MNLYIFKKYTYMRVYLLLFPVMYGNSGTVVLLQEVQE